MYDGTADAFAAVGWAAGTTVAVVAGWSVGLGAAVGTSVGTGLGDGGGAVGAAAGGVEGGAHAASSVVAKPRGTNRKKRRRVLGIAGLPPHARTWRPV